MPATTHFYIARREEYDRSLHPEAETEERVEFSEFRSRKKVVHERLYHAMEYDSTSVSSNSELIPMTFMVDARSDLGIRLDVSLYRSNEQLADHSPLRNANGELQAGIQEYPLMFHDIDSLLGYGFRVKGTAHASDKHHYELRTFIQLSCTSDRLEMTIHGMKHNYRYDFERPNGMRFSQDMVLFTCTQEVWNKSSSHFVRDTTGPLEPQSSGSKRKRDEPSQPQPQRRYKARTTRNVGVDYSEVQSLDG